MMDMSNGNGSQMGATFQGISLIESPGPGPGPGPSITFMNMLALLDILLIRMIHVW